MKARLSISLALVLMFCILVVPVLAIASVPTPPNQITIKAVQSGKVTSVEDKWLTGSPINQSRGVVNQGTIKLYIPNTASSSQYTFNFYNVYGSTVNTSVPVLNIRVNALWKLIVSGQVVGTFEWQIEWDYPNAHGNLHGTGIFEGQKLMFWRVYCVNRHNMGWNLYDKIDNPTLLFLLYLDFSNY
jgi:hypothetical protein